MDTYLVTQLLEYFKATYGIRVDSAEGLFDTECNVLEFVMQLGKEIENGVFEEVGKGYEGADSGKRWKEIQISRLSKKYAARLVR